MTALPKNDLLYTIFEHHLFNFQDPNSDRPTFIRAIVNEYLIHLRKLGLSVPKAHEEQIFEELFFQVNTMLVKKIYGCMTINEFTAKMSTPEKKTEQKVKKKKAKATYRAALSQVAKKAA